MTAASAANASAALTLSPTDINSVFTLAGQKYLNYYNSNISGHLSNIANIIPVNSNNSTSANTEATFQTANSGDWRAGFYGGVLWEVYGQTGNSSFLTPAENLTWAVHGTIASGDHDVGFRTLPTYVQGAQYVGGNFVYTLNGVTDDSYTQQTFDAANFLASRYVPAVGATRSWNNSGNQTGVQVIADNMMNIQLLFKAQALGDTTTVGGLTLSQIAINHARTTFTNFVRSDGSSVHEVIFNNDGTVQQKLSVQGITAFNGTSTYQTSGTWSRGQSWLINGFTQTYLNTGMAEFLSDAQTVANYWVTRTLQNVAVYSQPNNPMGAAANPDYGYIPPTDFDVSLVGTTDNTNHQDVSAACIAADGLLQLAVLTSDKALRDQYWNVATNTLLALMNEPGYLNTDTSKLSLFIHAGQAYTSGNQSNSFLYSDYYFLDALNQYQALLPTFNALDAAPEPTSIALVSLPVAAALVRRRRSHR